MVSAVKAQPGVFNDFWTYRVQLRWVPFGYLGGAFYSDGSSRPEEPSFEKARLSVMAEMPLLRAVSDHFNIGRLILEFWAGQTKMT